VKWKPLRIWDWRIKLVYVVAAYGAGWALVPVWSLLGVRGVFGTAFDIAAILLGARIFRGAGEQIDEPRPWWRMTSRPTMSRRFGILATVFGALLAVDIPLLYLAPGVHHPRPRTAWDGIEVGIGAVEFGVIAFLYLRSARRLGWREAPAPEIARPIGLDK
jgi:hypothetical protein